MNDNERMVKRPKTESEAERVGHIAQLVRSGAYPLDCERLADTMLTHPLAREHLALEPSRPRRLRIRQS